MYCDKVFPRSTATAPGSNVNFHLNELQIISIEAITINETRHVKTNISQKRNKKRRSASQ